MKTTLVALALLMTACSDGLARTADSLVASEAPTPVVTPAVTLPPVPPTVVSTLAPTPEQTAPAVVASVASALPEVGRPGRVLGVVTATDGRALAGIRVMRGDLTAQLATTDAQGRYDVPCGIPLLLTARQIESGPDASGGISRSPGSGAGNFAWRRVATRTSCGLVVRTRLAAGGVVEGLAYADSDRSGDCCDEVTLARMTFAKDGTAMYFEPGQPVFTVAVDDAGHYRIDGLDTGRYHIEQSVIGFSDEGTDVDVREGETRDGTFSVYMHEFPCEPDPPCPGP